MGLLGISLLVASVVYVVIRPPSWMPPWFLQWRGFGGAITQGPGYGGKHPDRDTKIRTKDGDTGSVTASARTNGTSSGNASTGRDTSRDKTAMPPPPLPIIQPPIIEEPDDQTTPKATVTEPSQPVPSFSLSEHPSKATPEGPPRLRDPPTSSMLPPPRSMGPPPTSMRPPPVPGRQPQPPRLQQFPAVNSPQRANGPVPNRRAPASSGLAPPPSHTSVPKKPSRKVILTPGHSPLDWAHISGPSADLRGLPASSSYMRVTPSMLKNQTGRKGKDAWMALNGKVYNVTPYADYHPGGVPELMRGAGKDGTRLFGEIHPWVNYETMLSACLVGLLVDEPESEMDKMD